MDAGQCFLLRGDGVFQFFRLHLLLGQVAFQLSQCAGLPATFLHILQHLTGCHSARGDAGLEPAADIDPGIGEVKAFQRAPHGHVQEAAAGEVLIEADNAAARVSCVAHVGQRRGNLNHLDMVSQVGGRLLGQRECLLGHPVLGLNIFRG